MKAPAPASKAAVVVGTTRIRSYAPRPSKVTPGDREAVQRLIDQGLDPSSTPEGRKAIQRGRRANLVAQAQDGSTWARGTGVGMLARLAPLPMARPREAAARSRRSSDSRGGSRGGDSGDPSRPDPDLAPRPVRALRPGGA